MTEEQALAILFRHWKEDQEKQPFPAWLPLTPNQLERRADLLRWILPAIIEAAGIVPEALRLLRSLADIQNGPPLEKWAVEWRVVMDEVYQFLDKYEKEETNGAE